MDIAVDEFARDPRLGPVVTPSRSSRIGLNYRRHAEETGSKVPTEPDGVHQVRLVALRAQRRRSRFPARRPTTRPNWSWSSARRFATSSVERCTRRVAGYCVGQDYSEREWQYRGSPAQFSLAKSFKNFAPDRSVAHDRRRGARPQRPRHLDDVERRDDAGLEYSATWCSRSPSLIAYLSSVCELRRGDLIFTGTPEGVGQARNPPVFLKPGDEIVTTIENLGRIRNVAVAP